MYNRNVKVFGISLYFFIIDMKNFTWRFLFVLFTFLFAANCNAQNLQLERITLPDGFQISIFAENVPNARSMNLSPNGTLFVGSRKQGKVYAVLDRDGDYRADEVITIASGLNMPNGVAFRDGDLYVAEIHRVIKFPDIEDHLNDPGEPQVVNDSFPDEGHHGWKFMRFGPDGKLYVPVGVPCNVCVSENPRFGTIMRMNPDGSELEIYAEGIRNTVGFDWHPETQELWFTDNGRDWMGDNRPPDELNRAPQAGLHFGFPYYHGADILDPEYGERNEDIDFVPPVQELGPHVAALGMRFYTGAMFPDNYHHQIFIAEHGSWNRSVPIGYRITLVRLEGNEAVSYETFAEGWLLENGEYWGRPVDVQLLPDGSMLVSDDYSGTIYRIVYQP